MRERFPRGEAGATGLPPRANRKRHAAAEAEWVKPLPNLENLGLLWAGIRTGWWLIVITVALALVGVAAYVHVAHKFYTAQSDLLVTPIQSSDPAVVSLGLVTASSDPTRGPQTAAKLVVTPQVAEQVRETLGLQQSASALLAEVKATPDATSDIVKVTATDQNPDLARRLADAFAQTVVALRTETMHANIARILPQLGAASAGLPPTDPRLTEVVQLRLLQSAPDPTLQVATHALRPTSPSAPRPAASLAAALVAGLTLGLFGCLALMVISPRVRDENQLRDRYRFPVLARVPRLPRSSRSSRRGRKAHSQLPESIHVLRAAVALSSPASTRSGRSVLITGPSGNEDSPAIALSLAQALAGAGNRVLLVETDRALSQNGALRELAPEQDLERVIAGGTSLFEALVSPAPGLHVLFARGDGTPVASELLWQRLLDEAERFADWVLFDGPPAGGMTAAVPLVNIVDQVLIVVRVARTKMRDLDRLTELLAEHRVEPAGFALVGAE